MAYGQEFNKAVGAVHSIHLFRENVELLGLQGGSIESVSNRAAASAKKYRDVVDEERRREKERSNMTAWLDLLNQIQAEVEALEQPFKDEFGEHYINAMAQRFLTAEEYNSVETDEERMQLMFDKYLNPDGTIRDEYIGVEGVEWIQRLHDTQPQIAKGRELAQRLTRAHAENGGNVPDEVVEEVQAELEEGGLAATVSFDEEPRTETSDRVYKQAVESNHLKEAGNNTDVTNTASLSFS